MNAEKSPLFSRRHFILVVFLLLIIAMVGIAIDQELDSPKLLPLKTVKVTGYYPHLDTTYLTKLLKPLVNTGFFAADISLIQQQIEQQPWVAEVSVRRIWPDTLIITIEEQQPVAYWNQTSLLNSYGEIFTPLVISTNNNLPQLNGPPDSALKVLDYYQQMLTMLQPTGLSIASLTLDPQEFWQLTLSNGTQVQLGNTNPLSKLQRFVQVYAKVFANSKNPAKVVDLRYSSGMAVQWENTSAN